MQKKIYVLPVTAFLALAITWSCQKSDLAATIHVPAVDVTASINGRVTDLNNLPVSGALVVAGAVSASTDVNGDFTIENVQLNKSAGFVKVNKSGYFTGSRTIVVNANVTNQVSIQLIKKTVSGNFTAASGGNVSVFSGGAVNFPANAIVSTTANRAYSGTVSVSAFFLNPAAANFANIMPGTLRGVNSLGQETGLQSFGMMAVELTGSGGEKLQLATGKTATITFPITPALRAQAPASIPLWYFDETTGLWKQEGTATRQGNNYVGTVQHFSFWNCDAPFPVIDFRAVIKDQQGNVLKNAQVGIKNTGDDTITLFSNGYTDATGTVAGKIPANKSLQLQVYNKCNTLLYSKKIGPFSSEANLGTITVPVQSPVTVSLSGTVINCNGEPVTNGYVNVLLDGGNNRAAIMNGSFSISINRCAGTAASARIVAVDLQTQQQGTPQNVTVSNNAVTTGQLNACSNSITQYIYFDINGTDYSVISPADSLSCYRNNNSTIILGETKVQTGLQHVAFNFPGNTEAGSYPVWHITLSFSDKYYVKNGTMNTTITEYGAVNGFVAGSITGMLGDSSSSGITVPLTCTFRVKRQQ